MINTLPRYMLELDIYQLCKSIMGLKRNKHLMNYD